LDGLIANGIYSPDALNDDVTISGTGWSGNLCGVWSEKHLVTGNDFTTNNYEEFPPVTKYMNDVGLHTVSIVHWNPINDNIIEEHADFKLNVGSDLEVGSQGANYLTMNDPDFMFLHFDDVDHAGHASGYSTGVPEYIAAIESVDLHIGMVLQALEARPGYGEEDWLILVTTDHSGLNFGHGGSSIDEQNIFVIASGNTLETQVIRKDSTVTIDNPFNYLGEETELFF
jgi:predicted AlkP superfamily pyrophosphatase or phosphodiesterase